MLDVPFAPLVHPAQPIDFRAEDFPACGVFVRVTDGFVAVFIGVDVSGLHDRLVW